MAGNWDTGAARTYHDATKHSHESVRRRARGLDWSTRPHPFKEYPGLEPLPLPPEVERLLRLGAGVVRTRTLPGGEAYHFRAYSSAGALYPVELYVATAELPALPAGLYHFHPRELALRRLRAGDVRAALADAAAAPALASSLAVLVETGILWRSAWKYDARAYRHLFWDAGTMLATLLAVAESEGLRAQVQTGFVDDAVNGIIGGDGDREAALALAGIGDAARAPTPHAPLEPALEPLSPAPGERGYPEAHALHRASSLAGAGEVERYRAGGGPEVRASPPLACDREALERAIRRRGSTREFASDPVPADELAAVLAAAAAPVPLDVPSAGELLGIANAVAGLPASAFRFRPPADFDVLMRGDFRRRAGYLVLEQPLGALAAATLFVMADLERVLELHGNRGYRAAQLEAGVRVGRVYLAASARGLGATASTFYDDDVSRFLAPDLAPLLAAAVGHPLR